MTKSFPPDQKDLFEHLYIPMAGWYYPPTYKPTLDQSENLTSPINPPTHLDTYPQETHEL